MSNTPVNYPPEMQEKIAQIMAGALQSQAPTPPPVPQNPANAFIPQPPPPAAQQPLTPPKPPSLVDHIIALRQESATLRGAIQELNQHLITQAGVLEGVAIAVGRMYQMFQPSEQQDQDPTYSQNFQKSQMNDSDGEY